MASFTLERRVSAPPEVVFDVLTNHRGYAEITPMRRVELERDPAPNGVGAIRVLHSVGPPVREEVVVYRSPERFSYTVLSGLPVRDHMGTVDLIPDGDGTRVVYALRLIPTIPVVGGVVVMVIKQAVVRLLDGVSAESERRASAANG